MNRRKCHWIVTLLPVAALLAGGFAAGARAQSLASDEAEFDCVIEPRSVVKLGSAEEGIITEITVDRGDIVKKGDAVAKLNFELEALAVELARVRAERDVEIRSSSARYSFRKREADRAAELHRKNHVSTKVRDEADIEHQLAAHGVAAAKSDRQMAELELKNAEERLDRRTIRSPVDGVVVEVTMSPGEFAHEQSPVMTVAQIDPLNVEVFVPVSRYGTIFSRMPAEVMPEPPVGGVYLARVQIVDRVFDTASGTFGVRLELPNPDYKLPAGLKCLIRFLPPDHVANEPETPESVVATTAEASEGDRAVPEEAAAVEPEEAAAAEPEEAAAVEPEEAAAVEPEEATAAEPEEAAAAEPAAADVPTGAEAEKAPRPEPRDDLVTRIQTELGKAGFSTGPPDGTMGPRTQAAIEAYQQRHQLEVTGLPSSDLLDHVRRSARPPEADAASPTPAEAPPTKPVGWYEKFRQASDAARSGKNRLAIRLFTEAIDADSLPPEYRLLAFKQRGHARYFEGLYDQAIKDYDQIVELGVADAQTYASRGASYIGTGRYRQAVRDYDTAIGMDATRARAYHGRGVAHANLGDLEQAIDDYRTANRLSPDYADAYFNRAIAYENMGNLVAAMEDYAALYELQPDYPGLKARIDKFGLAQ